MIFDFKVITCDIVSIQDEGGEIFMKSKINKTVLVISVFLLMILSISGCSFSKKSQSSSNEDTKLQQILKTNQKSWSNQIKDVPKVTPPGGEDGKESVESDHLNFSNQMVKGLNNSSFDANLLNSNKNVIEGTVINLEEMKDKLGTTTKATVLVDKVLSGENSLKGKKIKTEFGGGLNKTEYVYSDVEGNYLGDKYGYDSPNTRVYVNDPNFPMPKIGSKFVTQIQKYSGRDKIQTKNYKEKYQLTPNNFYIIKDPYVLFWVEKNGKYELNNPIFKNSKTDSNLDKITKQINKRIQ